MYHTIGYHHQSCTPLKSPTQPLPKLLYLNCCCPTLPLHNKPTLASPTFTLSIHFYNLIRFTLPPLLRTYHTQPYQLPYPIQPLPTVPAPILPWPFIPFPTIRYHHQSCTSLIPYSTLAYTTLP